MDTKLILSLLIVSFILIYGCAQPTQEIIVEKPSPASIDVIKETTETKIVEKAEETVVEPEEDAFSLEVKELLGLADKKVQSISYRYRGPQSGNFIYMFTVKDNKIKYTIDPTFSDPQLDDDAYDTIYLDTESKTALAYCDARNCRVKGKKTTLDYEENDIMTPIDWLDSIESAEKTGEELIDKRSTWKLETNIGTLWIDSFFGVPLQTESDGIEYKFEQMIFNGVKDDDVTPY